MNEHSGAFDCIPIFSNTVYVMVIATMKKMWQQIAIDVFLIFSIVERCVALWLLDRDS